jgi:hypothetical protein
MNLSCVQYALLCVSLMKHSKEADVTTYNFRFDLKTDIQFFRGFPLLIYPTGLLRCTGLKLKTILRGLSPRAKYTARTTAACRRS